MSLANTSLGLTCGLLSAILSALTYFVSGKAVRTNKELGPLGLFSRAHAVMCLIAVGLVACTWSPVLLENFWRWFPVTLLGALFYLGGQFCVLAAQRSVDSSRLIPLLGTKLIFLCLLNAYILRSESYRWPQYTAVLLTFLSAFLLADKTSGRRVSFGSLLWILAAGASYSTSDICIKIQMTHMTAILPGLAQSTVLSVGLSYFFSGLFGGLILFFVPAAAPGKARAIWTDAFLFAVCWLSCILFLYVTFHTIGTVNGGIAQATRGIFAILIGLVLVRKGRTDLEEKVDRRIILHRIVAATMMVASLALFNLL